MSARVAFLVTHLMGADLNNIVKTQKLSDDHVQFLVYQILRGMKYVHSAGIMLPPFGVSEEGFESQFQVNFLRCVKNSDKTFFTEINLDGQILN